MTARRKSGILISGRGSNMAALIDACKAPDFPAEISVVISNRADAPGLERARSDGIATAVVDNRQFDDRTAFEEQLDRTLRDHGVEIVCNAGFMRLLTEFFVQKWYNRQINIHPSLLPAYTGLHTHERILQDGVRITGYASLPHEQRSTSRAQYLFVNRRAIRDQVMSHAIRLAYQDLIPSSSHPVILLFLEIDPVEIDVNVHPNKTEIRFRDSRRVHRCIYRALEEALLRRRETLGDLARDIPLEYLRTQTLPGRRQSIARSVERFFHRHPDSSLGFREFRGYPGDRGPAGAAASAPVSGEDPHRFNIPETADLSPVPVVLGQFVESFIVASDRDGVMLIDQHVAHERILFDRAVRTMSAGRKMPTQRLLMPQTVELTAEQKTLLAPLLEHLNSNGFEVEWFGERTIVLKGVPAIASDCSELPRLIEEILAAVDVDPSASASGAEVQRLREKIAISVSCRSAIKINTPLSGEKMRWMVDELFRCENPYTCPHGRPITLRLNIEDVLRGFKRI